MGLPLPILKFPDEIILQIVHHPDLTHADRKAEANSCRKLNNIESDEICYQKLARSLTGYWGFAPISRDGGLPPS